MENWIIDGLKIFVIIFVLGKLINRVCVSKDPLFMVSSIFFLFSFLLFIYTLLLQINLVKILVFLPAFSFLVFSLVYKTIFSSIWVLTVETAIDSTFYGRKLTFFGRATRREGS